MADAARSLPHWPRRMQAPLAAAYCGVSTTKFLTCVREGRLPAGYEDGGNRLWYREDLDAALDRLKTGAPPAAAGDPFLAGLQHDGGTGEARPERSRR
jgi:hypothetical protein